MPRTTTAEWKAIFSDDEIAYWTNSLANLTLLSMRKNIQAQNYTFKEKKVAYQDKDKVVSSFIITQEILKEEKWNVDTLLKRKQILLSKIYCFMYFEKTTIFRYEFSSSQSCVLPARNCY